MDNTRTHLVKPQTHPNTIKCAISVLRKDEVPADLAKVVGAWDELTVEARQKIIEIVEGKR